MTPDVVVKYLQEQLDWRGPGGKGMGVLTLPRAMAELICARLAPGARTEPAGRPGEPGAGEDSPPP